MPYKDVKPSDIFKCRQCGDCCKGYGGTFVTEKEIKAIADYLKTDPESFVDNYCKVSGGKTLLAQGRDAYCLFWDGLCTIHPVKPRMCKNWPFIKSVLVDITNWHIMAALCPGIRTDFPDDVIKECVRKELTKNL
jgi:Fe-S-cluster containining protein